MKLDTWLYEMVKSYAMAEGISKREALQRIIKKLKKAQ